MNNKTEKPKSFDTKTEKPIKKYPKPQNWKSQCPPPHAMPLTCHAMPVTTSGLKIFIMTPTLGVQWKIPALIWIKYLFLVDTGDILIIMSLWRTCFAIQMTWKILIFLLMMNVSLVAVSNFCECFYWSRCGWKKKIKAVFELSKFSGLFSLKRKQNKSKWHTLTPTHGLASTLRMRTAISPGQWQPCYCIQRQDK